MHRTLARYLMVLTLLALCAIRFAPAWSSEQRVEISPQGMPFSVRLPAGFPSPTHKKDEYNVHYRSAFRETFCTLSISDFQGKLDVSELNANLDKFSVMFEDEILNSLQAKVDKQWTGAVQGRLRRSSDFQFESQEQHYFAQSHIIFNPPQFYTMVCGSLDPKAPRSSSIQDFFTSFRFKE